MLLMLVSVIAAVLVLMLVLKLSQRLTLRLKVLAGVSVSRQPQKSCPHLGSSADPFTHDERPTDDHRCYLWMQRDRIDLVHQKGFCLSSAHHKCPWLMIRRPDAPPPLRKRVPQLAGQLPRHAWGLGVAACMSTCRAMVALVGRAEKPVVQSTRPAAPVEAVLPGVGQASPPVSTRQAPEGLVRPGVGQAFLPARSRQAPPEHGQAQKPALPWAALAAFARFAVAFAHLAGRALAAAARWAAPRVARGMAVSAVWLGRHGALAIVWLARAAWAGSRLLVRGGISLVQAIADKRRQTSAAPALALAQAAAAQPEPKPVAAEPVFAASLAALEELIAEGVATLDRGQESLAHAMFAKATEQRAPKNAPAGDYQDLMKRAWFWRAKTAETVSDVVHSLEKALELDPDNLQMQAQLAWAKQRLEREHKLQTAQEQPAEIRPLFQYVPPRPQAPRGGLGEAVRVLGGVLALALAVLWMTTALAPALGRALTSLPPADQGLIQRLVLTINASALPGKGHLPLPMLNYDLGLSIPFVLAFLFVFTARGLMDGDPWARRGALLLAALGAWLCAVAVANPDAGRLGLALCLGVIAAALVGRFDSPKVLPELRVSY